MSEWKNDLPKYRTKDGQHYFVDVLPYYQTLRIDPVEVTKKRIDDDMEEGKCEDNLGLVALLGLFTCSKDFDGAYDLIKIENKEREMKKFLLKFDCEAYCDLKVTNGTFANYVIRDNGFNVIEKFPLPKEGNDFVLHNDIKNPLFPSVSGVPLLIETDGALEYKRIFILKGREVLYNLDNIVAINRLHDFGKVHLVGHLWFNSVCTEESELIECTNEEFIQSQYNKECLHTEETNEESLHESVSKKQNCMIL